MAVLRYPGDGVVGVCAVCFRRLLSPAGPGIRSTRVHLGRTPVTRDPDHSSMFVRGGGGTWWFGYEAGSVVNGPRRGVVPLRLVRAPRIRGRPGSGAMVVNSRPGSIRVRSGFRFGCPGSAWTGGSVCGVGVGSMPYCPRRGR
jgi:hypothetical protein